MCLEVIPMELMEAITKRTSVRSFTDEPVSDEEISRLLHAAMAAPSAVNRQPWEFYVVRSQAKIAELNKVGFAKYKAPLAIVVAGNAFRFIPFGKEYWIEDASAATENMLLAATDLGLGAVWCAVYPLKRNVKQVKEILHLPAHITPLNIVLIGHPKGKLPEPHDKFDEKKIHFVDDEAKN
jgi:nitroreductase